MGIETAIIGSAILGAGASAYSASKANKAAKTAADATQQAADASTAEAARQYDQTRQDYAPWRAVGQGALTALAQQYGITIPTTEISPSGTQAPGTAPARQASEVAQLRAYLAENPDVAQAWETSAKNNPKYGGDALAWAQDHYQQWGQSEGRQLPAAPAAQPQTQTAPVAPQAPAPTQPSGMATQIAGAGPALPARQDYTRPTTPERPTMTRPVTAARPTISRPTTNPLDISLDAYQESPDLRFQLDEARKGTIAATGASGSLQSGAAAKALQDRAQNIAASDFNSWVDRQIRLFDTANDRTDRNYAFDAGRLDSNFNFDSSRADSNFNFDAGRSDQNFVYDTNRRDNIFESDRAFGTDVYNQDRSYLTNRYDTKTSGLFSLAGMGTTANAANAQAGQTYSNILGDNLFSTAAAQGKAAQTIAGNNSQAVGNILGIGSGLLQTATYSPSAYKTIATTNNTVAYTPEAAVTAYRPSNILM